MAEAVLAGHVAEARARKRLRCQSQTTYEHANLVHFVQTALPPGWTAHGPGPACAGPDPPAAPSQYPPVNDAACQRALGEFLESRGVDRATVAGLDLEDELNGHCETVAASLAHYVMLQLEAGGCPAESVLDAAVVSMIGDLDSGSTAEQVAILFGPKAKQLSDPSPRQRGSMWGGTMAAEDAAALETAMPGPADDYLVEMLAGAPVGLSLS